MSHALKPISPVRLAHLAGVVIVGAGLVYWPWQLRRLPVASPSVTQAVPHRPAAVNPDVTVVTGWLAPGEVRLNIRVIGLVRRQNRAVAVLSLNDAPAASYMAGELLMSDVVLQSIEADGITVRRSGSLQRIAAPALPNPDPSGIVRAS